MTKVKRKNEFRKNNSKKGKSHPTYFYGQNGKKHNFIGLTHAEITDGIKNIPLEINPEPGNNTVAHIRTECLEAHKSNFGIKLKEWFFTDNDKKKVEEVIKKSNKK